MDMVSGISVHTIVLVLDKKDRSIALTKILKKEGYRIFAVSSLYEALRVIDQEMPHLVISDAILTDGTVGNLFDRLQSHPVLSSTPILSLVAEKTKEQLTPLKGRKFAGFILGKFDSKTLLNKVKEVLTTHCVISPYFLDLNEDSASSLNLFVEATALGLSGDQVVYESESEIDSAASLVCLPEDSSKSPALLKMGSNIIYDNTIYNLFPLSRVKGKGRSWISELPNISISCELDVTQKRVLFFDPNQRRFEQFQEVLLGYGIELVHMSSMQAVASYICGDISNIDCIYLDELASDSGSIALKENLLKIDPNKRPVVIAGTSSLNARSTAEIRYIHKPFGLGILVEMIEAASMPKSVLSEQVANLAVTYQAQGKILGLDETGGVLQIKFPMPKGSVVHLDHEFLKELWDGHSRVTIEEVAPLPQNSQVWQAKFTANHSLNNKVKYFEKLRKALDGYLDSQKTA